VRSIHEHTLDMPFVAEGQFWLPEAPETVVAGTLNYSPGSITVNLIGDPGEIGVDNLLGPAARMRELILGSTSVGACALWNAFTTSAKMRYRVGGRLAVATYRANRLYVGDEYESVEEIEFTDVVVSFDLLPTWLGHNPFGSAAADSDALHRYIPFGPVAVEVPGEELRIELSTRVVDRGGGYRGFTWVHEVRFVVRSPSPKHVEWHLEVVGRLQTFLSTLVGGAVVATSIVGHLKESTISTHVIPPLTRAPEADSLSEFQMLLPYGVIKDRFPDALRRWMAEWQRIETTVALLYGTLLVELPPEFEFLAVTQALETFHRHVRQGMYLSEEDYEKIATSLRDAIPSGTPSDLSQSLKSRIKYGNEYSQRKRFHELIDALDATAKDLLRIDKALLSRVVDERNHLSHRPPESEEYVPMSNSERRVMAQRLKAFLFLLLLTRVGFTGDDVKARFAMSRWGWATSTEWGTSA
jgi:hypothetical protein